MSAIEILAPVSGPPGLRPPRSRGRFRPTLSSLGWIILYASTFLYYQHRLRDQSHPVASSLPPSTASLASDATPPSIATASCEVCHLNPADPLCEYGLDNIRLSRAYEGSGIRLRRVLEKALRGEEVGIGILGASVTAGHSVPYGKQRWEDRFFEDFQKLFPKAKMHVGAVSAVDSRFFAYCFEAVVPKDLDLYLVELDINDPPDLETLRDVDALMRGLLQLPQNPAVVRVSVFAIVFDELARGAVAGLITSQFFDVPVITIRNFLLPQVMHHRDDANLIFGLDQWGGRDYRHISETSHRALADMISLFIRKEVCETQRRDMLPPPPQLEKSGPWPVEEDLVKLPPQTLFGSWLRDERPKPVTPLCQSTSAPFSPLVPLSHSKAFKKVEWNEKIAWISSIPGSQIRFRFTGSKVGVFVYVTNGSGKDEASQDPKVRRREAPGSALCWVEEPEMDEKEWEEKFAKDGKEAAELQSWIVNTHWPQKAASGSEFVELADGLHAGEHILACEVSSDTTSGGHKWRVQGIASM